MIRSIIIRDHKLNRFGPGYRALQAIAHGNVHGGYRWYLGMDDGELLCEPCVRENFREILDATRFNPEKSGWQSTSLINSGEIETPQFCAHCGKFIPRDGN
jgi:hypothetical protein